MVLAAVEAYCLGDGRRSGAAHLETLGYVWGFGRIEDELTVLYVTKLSMSLSARRTNNSVTPNLRAALLKNEVIRRWSPQLSLLGDFHTHPYEDLSQVQGCNGFEFSTADYASFAKDDLVWNESGNSPLMLAMTICKLNRVHTSIGGEQIRGNVWRFDVGEYRLWLNAAVGELDAQGNRVATGNKYSKVDLDLNSRFFNISGDRIIDRLSA